MLKKILKALLGQQSHKHRSYSSSDYKKRRHYGNHNSYGHGHYKKKHKSSKFSSFFSS